MGLRGARDTAAPRPCSPAQVTPTFAVSLFGAGVPCRPAARWAGAGALAGCCVLPAVTPRCPVGVVFLQVQFGVQSPTVKAFQPRLCWTGAAPSCSSRGRAGPGREVLLAAAARGRAGWRGAGARHCRLGSMASSHGPVSLSHPIFSVRFVLVLLDVHPNSPHRCHGARTPLLGQVGLHLRTLGRAPSPFALARVPGRRLGAALPGRGGCPVAPEPPGRQRGAPAHPLPLPPGSTQPPSPTTLHRGPGQGLKQ